MNAQAALEITSVRSQIMLQRYRFSTEAQLRDLLGVVLLGSGAAVFREFQYDTKNRFDLWLPEQGIVVECKTDESLDAAWRQCARYLQLEQVHGVLLATTCKWARDVRIKQDQEKPFAVAYLQRQFL